MSRVHVFTAVLIAAVALAAPASAQTKVAVIDVERVVQESDPGKEALQKLKALQDQKIEEGQALQQELDALREQFNAQRLTLSEEKVDETRKQIEDKSIELKRFQDDAQRELDEARRRELGRLEQRIMPIIDQVGQEQGITLIFNKFQSGLVYADENVDITNDVILRFNTSQ